MKRNDKCLPCMINQVIKVSNMIGIDDKDQLLRKVFTYLSTMNFGTSTPEMIGEIFEVIKIHSNNPDPYKETRNHYNSLFLDLIPQFQKQIEQSSAPFPMALKYAILGNIIDFNPMHNTLLDDIYSAFAQIDQQDLAIDDSDLLIKEITTSKCLLYLGDNCGEICMDKILIQKIKELNPSIELLFAVRGKPVVNDSIAEDGYFVGIDEYAEIIDNGDSSLGTVLHRTSSAFQAAYEKADIIIAKGQANYECLSEENKNIYFLLVTKCDVIAHDIGVDEKNMVCMKNPFLNKIHSDINCQSNISML